MKNLTLFMLVFLVTSQAQSQVLRFEDNGEAREIHLSDIQHRVAASPVTIVEPHSGEDRVYFGMAFNALMDEVYGESWKTREEVLFTCSDGYQPSIPVREFQKYTSYLVYKLADGGPFVTDNRGQNEKAVPLGPFYLVWDNVESPELLEESASYWPYQVVAIELTDFNDRFSALLPDRPMTEKEEYGFLNFRRYCMSCHKINGAGGSKGPDLTTASKRFPYDWIKAFVDDPRRFRPGTTMSLMSDNIKDREEKIDSIAAYLFAVGS